MLDDAGRLVGAIVCRNGFDARGVGAAVLAVVAASTLLFEFLRPSLFLILPKNPVLRSILDVVVECDEVRLQNDVDGVLMARDMVKHWAGAMRWIRYLPFGSYFPDGFMVDPSLYIPYRKHLSFSIMMNQS